MAIVQVYQLQFCVFTISLTLSGTMHGHDQVVSQAMRDVFPFLKQSDLKLVAVLENVKITGRNAYLEHSNSVR